MGVDVVAEDDPCVRGEGAQVAVVDLGGGESDTSHHHPVYHKFIKFIKIGENRRPLWGSELGSDGSQRWRSDHSAGSQV